MFYRLKPYLRRNALLVVLVVAGLAGVGYMLFSLSGARGDLADTLDERDTVERRRAVAVSDAEEQRAREAAAAADLVQKRQELDRVTEKLRMDSEAASISSLTSSRDAEGLDNQIFDAAARNRLDIVDFQSAETVTTIDGAEVVIFIKTDTPEADAQRIERDCPGTVNEDPQADILLPTFTYTFEVQGGRNALINLLGLAESAPTTRIETLELNRLDSPPDVWNMKVCMHVPYGEE